MAAGNKNYVTEQLVANPTATKFPGMQELFPLTV